MSKVAFNYTDLTPIAAMAQDEFLLWVKQDAPYKTVADYLKAAASSEFAVASFAGPTITTCAGWCANNVAASP